MLLCLLFSAPVLADEPIMLRGKVQEMVGGTAGPGVPQVRVSNGRDIVSTDADGAYSIALKEGETLFVIKPAGYSAVRHIGSGESRFWQHHLPEGSPALRYGGMPAQDALRAGGDFVLLPDDRSIADGALDVLLFGDPQPKSLRDVAHYARDIVEPILAEAGNAPAAHLGLSLGDIVDDDLSLYPALNAVTTRLGLPWLHAPGNHDLDFDAADDAGSLHSFRAVFGADTYAWEESQANFVVLDNVVYQPGPRAGYIGGLRDDQFAFLQAYLAGADRDRLLVLAAHIPFFDPEPDRETFRRADRERLFALLQGFPKVLLLTAHTHMQMHHYHGATDGWHGSQPLHEYNVGTTCGAFWSGAPDADGIPDSTMADGTPNGYARLRVERDGRYALRWHAARDAALDVGIALHVPKVLRKGAFPAFGVYANVFMGHAGSVVEYRIDDG
ncbi:MAG TPA: calcineurin-like phosphoesterase family protein, partial [Arenimonas sp.]|nr:calcineurin-like phosphoesterase family protein [Arenimonas sp.]